MEVQYLLFIHSWDSGSWQLLCSCDFNILVILGFNYKWKIALLDFQFYMMFIRSYKLLLLIVILVIINIFIISIIIVFITTQVCCSVLIFAIHSYIFIIIIFNIRFTVMVIIKFGFSPSKKVIFICFNESPLKMMKNTFYFILKALCALKIFKFLSWFFGDAEKTAWLDR